MTDLERLTYEKATMEAASIVIAVCVVVAAGLELFDAIVARLPINLPDDLWFALALLGVILAARWWRNAS